MIYVRLVLLFPLLTACFPEEDDEPIIGPVCGDGIVEGTEQCDGITETCSSTCQRLEVSTVHWHTSSVSGAVHSCPPGSDRADVIVDNKVAASASCSLGAARVSTLAKSGDHVVSVQFSNATEVYGQTLEQPLREVTETTMFEDSGYVHLSWTFRDAAGETLDCYQANAADVRLTITSSGGTQTQLSVPCKDLATFTPPLVATTYTIDVATWSGLTETFRARLTDVVIDKRSAVTEEPIVVLVN